MQGIRYRGKTGGADGCQGVIRQSQMPEESPFRRGESGGEEEIGGDEQGCVVLGS